MDKDTKILLMAVVIILVALVSFNLGDLTGKVVNKAGVTVTPTTLTFAKNDVSKLITVKVSLGSTTADQKVYMYQESGTRMGSESLLLCRSDFCGSKDLKPSYQYALSSDLSAGRYYFVVRDRKNNIIAQSNKFTIAK